MFELISSQQISGCHAEWCLNLPHVQYGGEFYAHYDYKYPYAIVQDSLCISDSYIVLNSKETTQDFIETSIAVRNMEVASEKEAVIAKLQGRLPLSCADPILFVRGYFKDKLEVYSCIKNYRESLCSKI